LPYDVGTITSALSVSRDGLVAYTMAYLQRPSEVFVAGEVLKQRPLPHRDRNPGVLGLTHHNDALLAELDLPCPESVDIEVEGGKMQMWILKPPGFDPKKKWPLAYLVHGGPQSAWTDNWSYRWNPQLWAAQGYVVALPNPRGSTGFGQKYVDEISGDWGGKCYDDLMKGVDYLEKLPYIDKDRLAAAGASFGGYMMNWFAVNTGRFKCLITHCSVWNFESMYGTTDELWFDEWEHGGPPWGPNRHSYEKHSPHRLAANLGKFKTPMLVIHNDLDFRCPIGQGHELFTALQRQGVPSRMVNFPDEGHWVLKPKNSERWHQEVFAWLTKYVPPGGR
jgi:dipeptidyl aminopeptidase/acylaminoacyl peptidase